MPPRLTHFDHHERLPVDQRTQVFVDLLIGHWQASSTLQPFSVWLPDWLTVMAGAFRAEYNAREERARNGMALTHDGETAFLTRLLQKQTAIDAENARLAGIAPEWLSSGGIDIADALERAFAGLESSEVAYVPDP
jgi:hypothetical protein